MEKTQVLIIGSGPAGYTAAVYASRAGLSATVLTGLQPGGQLTTTTTIENFPGFPEGIDGTQLMENMRAQATRLGAQVIDAAVTSIELGNRPFVATADNGTTIEAQSVIIATGASAKYLGLDDEKKYNGMGVSACATCDGFFYRKRTVAVVGGGDTACEEAHYLAGLAKKVYLIVRKPYLRATAAMQERVKATPNIEILFNCNAVGLFGDGGVDGAHIVRHMGTAQEEKFDIDIQGFFLAIGHQPNTGFLNGQVELDAQGFIKLVNQPTSATSVPGVFAAGDVADPQYRQAITAAASGCRAAIDAKHYIDEQA